MMPAPQPTKTNPALPPAGTPITRHHVTAYAATLIANRWHDTAELITRMADQIWPQNEIEKGPHDGLG